MTFKILNKHDERRWKTLTFARNAKVDARTAVLVRDFTAIKRELEVFDFNPTQRAPVAQALASGDTALAGELLAKAIAEVMRDKAIDQIHDEEET